MSGDAPSASAQTPGDFSAAVAAITNALGDRTRREIYLFAHDHDRGVTAAQMAERFGLHPTSLATTSTSRRGGYLEVDTERAECRCRSSVKHYKATGERIVLEVPVKTDDLVLTLLGRALSMLPPAEAGRWPKPSASSTAAMRRRWPGTGHSARSATLSTRWPMRSPHRFRRAPEPRQPLTIINDHCPFGETAIQHPVICAVVAAWSRACSDAVRRHRAGHRSSLPRRHGLRHRALPFHSLLLCAHTVGMEQQE
jgi:predicted ArsR family transcriptional regulator